MFFGPDYSLTNLKKRKLIINMPQKLVIGAIVKWIFTGSDMDARAYL